MRPVIHSEKHYVQITRSTVTTVTRNFEDLILVKSLPSAVDEVVEGAVIKAVYIELWTLNSSNAGSEVVTLGKYNASTSGPTFTEMNSLGTFVQKKNILFTHQGLSANDGVGNPMNIMRAWYKIPKSKQRFGLGDSLRLSIANNGANTVEYCGFATYKEYT